MTQLLLKTENLSGGYKPGVEALKGISIAVNAGEVVGILGPNGGGKTTLFRALLDELPIRQGTVEIVGRPGYVPQTSRPRLDFPVNALDVVLMGAFGRTPWYRRVARADRDSALASLDRVGLADKAKVAFGALSGGQRQRVLIARALVQDASVILLDEPLSGVDVPSAEKIDQVVSELRTAGRAVLIATHDIHHVRRFDKVLCIRKTQIAYGDPRTALTPAVLKKTYGEELVILDGETSAVAIQHHDH